MEDTQIIALYFDRNEKALKETADKYGKYCYKIAYNVLNDEDDSKESVNDTYLNAWNSMPPHRPSVLSAFLGKITRRIAISRLRKKNSEKRGGGQFVSALEELSECIPNESNVENDVEKKLIIESVNLFVRNLPQKEQKVFLCRYWYMDSISSIAKQFGFSESKVKSMLMRTRTKLKDKLIEEELV
ncbi:MAG: RNA polymerase sigma factor [Acutalibacteraceae bacterium]